MDASETLRGDQLDSVSVVDAGGRVIALSSTVYHPWATRWIYLTAALPQTVAQGTAKVTVSGTDTSGNAGGGKGPSRSS